MYLMSMSLVTLFLASCDLGNTNDEGTEEGITTSDSTTVSTDVAPEATPVEAVIEE